MRNCFKQYGSWYIIFAFFFACSHGNLNKSETRHNRAGSENIPYVVLVSIDGYRYDYTTLYNPPELTKFSKEGASAKSLLPVFPSKTFTNHYSIATGLYAENHGIVANQFYDPIKDKEFKVADENASQDGSWYGGEPLWVAAEKQGLLAATYFWPGSAAEILGIRPSFYYKWNKGTTLDERVDQVGRWLKLPESERPHFIAIYISDVDSAGHKFGPNSVQVKNAIFKVDQAIGNLLSKIRSTDLPVNVIILSDHGMQEVNSNQVEYLDDYADLENVRTIGDGPQVLLYTKDSKTKNRVYNALTSKAKHFKVYKRENIPSKFHYSKTPRVGDIVVFADAPYSVGTHDEKFKVNPGNHGFDSDTTPTMQGIFYALGPQIKNGARIPSFRNIHIYPWIMKILGLQLNTTIDGDSKVLNQLLIPNKETLRSKKSE